MHEIIQPIEEWLRHGKSVALATVVHTWGSSPRGLGARMAMTAEGDMIGSVSGGCVETAVIEAGIESLGTETPRFLQFGVADETAWDVGLACGGEIEVFVQPLNVHWFEKIRSGLESAEPLLAAVILHGPVGWMGGELLLQGGEVIYANLAHSHENEIEALVDQIQQVQNSQRISVLFEPGDAVEIFVEVIQPLPALVIVGGVHIAIPLVTLANTLGYTTTLIDPRKKFGSRERFSHADKVINAWPDKAFQEIRLTPSTAVAVLTHDPKIDDPALMAVLPSPAFYVGALGSRKTQSQRRQRLLEMGLAVEYVDRLHGPIGLDLGGRSPEEIALGIMAQIVKIRPTTSHLPPATT